MTNGVRRLRQGLSVARLHVVGNFAASLPFPFPSAFTRRACVRLGTGELWQNCSSALLFYLLCLSAQMMPKAKLNNFQADMSKRTKKVRPSSSFYVDPN